LSHTGAISGDNDVFDALLDHPGALKVDTLDELFSTATLLASPRKPPTDGFVLCADSGGLCGSAADRAATFGIDFCPLTEKTCEGLKAQMPLSYAKQSFRCLHARHRGLPRAVHDVMLSDPNIGLYAVNLGNDDSFDIAFTHRKTALDAFAATDKPMFVVGYTGFSQRNLIEACYAAETPLIIPMDNALVAARCFLEYHRRLGEQHAEPADADAKVMTRWQAVLSKTPVLDEKQSLALFADFGVPVIESRRVECAEELVAAAESVTFAVALKTAAEGVHHKSDVDGVVLNLDDESALRAAYESLSSRLGAQALVSAMAQPGVEIALGMYRDATVGPVVVVGPGGTLVEYFDDRVFAIPPFDAGTAKRLLARLKFSRMLEGVRGKPAADLDSLAQALANFSVLCAALCDDIAEVDINPLIAGPSGVVVVDGLVVSASSAER
jgi:acyl-CoA synthetase (NDP forming)